MKTIVLALGMTMAATLAQADTCSVELEVANKMVKAQGFEPIAKTVKGYTEAYVVIKGDTYVWYGCNTDGKLVTWQRMKKK